MLQKKKKQKEKGEKKNQQNPLTLSNCKDPQITLRHTLLNSAQQEEVERAPGLLSWSALPPASPQLIGIN